MSLPKLIDLFMLLALMIEKDKLNPDIKKYKNIIFTTYLLIKIIFYYKYYILIYFILNNFINLKLLFY